MGFARVSVGAPWGSAPAPEHGLQLLNHLAVAPDGAVEALEVAVDHEDEVVEAFSCRDGEGAERLGLVALAVADEAPHPRAARVLDVAVHEITVEAGLVGG